MRLRTPALLGIILCAVTGAEAEDYFVYFGTYTATVSKGIYAYRFEPSTGELTSLGVAAEAPNPSFLAISPNRRFLYAVNWKASGSQPGNTVSAFGIDSRSGKLAFLNKVSSHGEMPTHLAIDARGQTLLVANYGSGTVASFPILSDGRLGEAVTIDQHSGPVVTGHESGAHAHAVLLTPDQHVAFAADLGLDRVYAYRFDPARHSLSPSDPPYISTAPDSGPRHLALHPNGRFLYVNNERSSSVTAFVRSADGGALTAIQTLSTLPPDFRATNTTAEIQIDRDGRFLYVSNRGHDSIAVFRVNSGTGALTPVEHVSTQGKTPRNFSLDPTGQYLFAANEGSSTVVLFRVNPRNGRLTPAGQVLSVPSPSCVVFTASP